MRGCGSLVRVSFNFATNKKEKKNCSQLELSNLFCSSYIMNERERVLIGERDGNDQKIVLFMCAFLCNVRPTTPIIHSLNIYFFFFLFYFFFSLFIFVNSITGYPAIRPTPLKFLCSCRQNTCCRTMRYEVDDTFVGSFFIFSFSFVILFHSLCKKLRGYSPDSHSCERTSPVIQHTMYRV